MTVSSSLWTGRSESRRSADACVVSDYVDFSLGGLASLQVDTLVTGAGRGSTRGQQGIYLGRLGLVQKLSDPGSQERNLVDHDVPDQVVVDSEVAMDEAISHSHHGAPLDVA